MTRKIKPLKHNLNHVELNCLPLNKLGIVKLDLTNITYMYIPSISEFDIPVLDVTNIPTLVIPE